MAESRLRFCDVSGCREMYSKEINTKENGITVFQVPKLSLERWQEVMPTSKLTKTSRICSRHFDDNDVLKGVTDSLNVFYPYKNWKLKTWCSPQTLFSRHRQVIYLVVSELIFGTYMAIIILEETARPPLQTIIQRTWQNNIKGIHGF